MWAWRSEMERQADTLLSRNRGHSLLVYNYNCLPQVRRMWAWRSEVERQADTLLSRNPC